MTRGIDTLEAQMPGAVQTYYVEFDLIGPELSSPATLVDATDPDEAVGLAWEALVTHQMQNPEQELLDDNRRESYRVVTVTLWTK